MKIDFHQNTDLLPKNIGALIAAQKENKIFYHGTSEKFENLSTDTSIEKLLWMADRADIAQTYIPTCGINRLIILENHNFEQRITPPKHRYGDSFIYDIAKKIYSMPFDDDLVYDSKGKLVSWISKKDFPKYIDVFNYFVSLGYKPSNNSVFSLNVSINEKKEEILHADYSLPGRLFIVFPSSKLNFLDIRTSNEGDLSDPEHLKFKKFKYAQDNGFDGVIINDFCQTKIYGNVNHISYGLTSRGLSKCNAFPIDAVHFEPKEGSTWPEYGITPELFHAMSRLNVSEEMFPSP